MTTIESSFDIDLALVEGYIRLDVVGFLLDSDVSIDIKKARLPHGLPSCPDMSTQHRCKRNASELAVRIVPLH